MKIKKFRCINRKQYLKKLTDENDNSYVWYVKKILFILVNLSES